MSGLIDATTGLEFGSGLQFQTQIGTGGLDIQTLPVAVEIAWGANATDYLDWGGTADTILTWGT